MSMSLEESSVSFISFSFVNSVPTTLTSFLPSIIIFLNASKVFFKDLALPPSATTLKVFISSSKSWAVS